MGYRSLNIKPLLMYNLHFLPILNFIFEHFTVLKQIYIHFGLISYFTVLKQTHTLGTGRVLVHVCAFVTFLRLELMILADFLSVFP